MSLKAFASQFGALTGGHGLINDSTVRVGRTAVVQNARMFALQCTGMDGCGRNLLISPKCLRPAVYTAVLLRKQISSIKFTVSIP